MITDLFKPTIWIFFCTYQARKTKSKGTISLTGMSLLIGGPNPGTIW